MKLVLILVTLAVLLGCTSKQNTPAPIVLNAFPADGERMVQAFQLEPKCKGLTMVHDGSAKSDALKQDHWFITYSCPNSQVFGCMGDLNFVEKKGERITSKIVLNGEPPEAIRQVCTVVAGLGGKSL